MSYQLNSDEDLNRAVASNPQIASAVAASMKPSSRVVDNLVVESKQAVDRVEKMAAVLGTRLVATLPRNNGSEKGVMPGNPLISKTKSGQVVMRLVSAPNNPGDIGKLQNEEGGGGAHEIALGVQPSRPGVAEPGLRVSVPYWPVVPGASQPSDELPANNDPIIIPPAPAAPDTSIIDQPRAIGSSSLVRFVFESDIASSTFECVIDRDAWQICESPFEFEPGDGIHRFEVRSINGGLADATPAQSEWIVDTAPPVARLATISETQPSASLEIGWSGEDAGGHGSFFDVEARVNGGEWRIWQVGTVATSAVYSGPLLPGDLFEVRLRGCDALGNCQDYDVDRQARTRIVADHLVISAVQASGATAKDEWIELYNPTESDISLAGYKLKRKSQTGSEYALVSDFGSRIIRSNGHLLVAHPAEYDGREVPDVFYGSAAYAVSNDNAVLLYNATTVVDKAGFGSASDYEGVAAGNPDVRQALVRKSDPTGYRAGQGNGRDTGNNSDDFEIVDNYGPHASDAPDEPNDAVYGRPAPVELRLDDAAENRLRLSWIEPDMSLGQEARYELKYLATSGPCHLARQWHGLSAAEGLPSAGQSHGETVFELSGLSAGTRYCIAARINYGNGWSVLSDQLAVRTDCAPLQSQLDGYQVRYALANNHTAPEQPPEAIMIVDVNTGSTNIAMAVPSACGIQHNSGGMAVWGYNMTRMLVEIVYDQTTKKFTGQYRACQNGWYYQNAFVGDGPCRDLATWWGGSRWLVSEALVGQSAVAVKAGGEAYTRWLEAE